MSKLITRAAKAAFERYPEAEVLYVTHDGNAFLANSKGMAEHHARQERLPAPVEVRRAELMTQRAIEQVAEAAKNASINLGTGESQASAIVLGVVRGADLIGEKVKLRKGLHVEGVEVLQRAYVASGLSVEEWNAQTDDAILDLLFKAAEEMKQAAANQ